MIKVVCAVLCTLFLSVGYTQVDYLRMQNTGLKKTYFLNGTEISKLNYYDYLSLNKDFSMDFVEAKTKKSKTLFWSGLALFAGGVADYYSDRNLNILNGAMMQSGFSLLLLHTQQKRSLNNYLLAQEIDFNKRQSLVEYDYEAPFLQQRNTLLGKRFFLDGSKVSFKKLGSQLPNSEAARNGYERLKKRRQANNILYWTAIGLATSSYMFVVNKDLRNISNNDRVVVPSISIVGVALSVASILRIKKTNKLTQQFINSFNVVSQ